MNLPDLQGSDSRYREVLDNNFTGLTPENEMKWDTIEPRQGIFNFGPGDAIVNYAVQHGMSVHGHNLIGNQQLPNWLISTTWTKSELKSILRQHISSVVGHYKNQVHEWDVINEPFNDDGTLQDNIWVHTIGPSYISLALKWAHEADARAKLFINDYNVDWPGPKEQALVALVKQLQQTGITIDGIGMEEHLSLAWAPSADQLAEAMGHFAQLDLEVQVTEADIDTTGSTLGPRETRAAHAAIFGRLASTCRAQPACARFSVWGVSDAVSWLGVAAAGLPFDADYDAKPAWSAILSGLREGRS